MNNIHININGQSFMYFLLTVTMFNYKNLNLKRARINFLSELNGIYTLFPSYILENIHKLYRALHIIKWFPAFISCVDLQCFSYVLNFTNRRLWKTDFDGENSRTSN